ncbi:hypothetical protein C8Q73DRAFT_675770 [Cubamyces lactineus]|nr:hypothetical protein C8Q73DRAFT_675770 [Cubamyces lactineus]
MTHQPLKCSCLCTTRTHWLERRAEYTGHLQPLPTSICNDLIVAIREVVLGEERVHVHFGLFLTDEETMNISASTPISNWEGQCYKVMIDKRYKDVTGIHGSRIVSMLNHRLSVLDGISNTPSFIERHTISIWASGSVFVLYSLGNGLEDEAVHRRRFTPRSLLEAFPGENYKPALDIFQELSRAVGPKEPMWSFDGDIHGPFRFNCRPFKRSMVMGRNVARLLRARDERNAGATWQLAFDPSLPAARPLRRVRQVVGLPSSLRGYAVTHAYMFEVL